MDYIEIPSWITHENIQNSRYLKSFFNDININGKKMGLGHLRDLYIKDRDTYQRVVDEMALRGFKFITHKPNNVLPKYMIENPEVMIKINTNSGNYKNIIFENLGISGFVNRFLVESDEFFNNIPIEGFLYLNREGDINKIIRAFLHNGFEVTGDIKDAITENISSEFKYADLNLKDLNLSTKSHNWLAKNRIDTIPKFIKLDHIILKNYGDIGQQSIDEICNAVAEILGTKHRDKTITNTKEVESINIYEIRSQDISIENLEFSTRTQNALKRARIKTISKLIDTDEKTLLKIRNIGKKSIEEIRTKIALLEKDQLAIETVRNMPQEIESEVEIQSEFLKYIRKHTTNNMQITQLGLSKRSENALLRNGINYISELLDTDIETIKKFRNIGRKSLIEIQKNIDEYREKLNIDYVGDSYILELSEDILSSYGEVEIRHLGEEFEDNRTKIKDLYGRHYEDLFNMFGARSFGALIARLKGLKPFNQILEEIKLSDREQFVLKSTMMEGKTLEETGQLIDLTRERIRQIRAKAERKVNVKLRNSNYIKMLKLLNHNKMTCISDLVRDSLCGNELLYYMIKNSKESLLKYEEITDHFFFLGIDEFRSKIQRILDNQEDIFDMIDIFDDLINLSENFDIELEIDHVENFINNHGYNIYGETVSKKRLSTMDVLSLLFKEYIDVPLRIDEEGYQYCLELAEKHLGFTEMATSWRGIADRMNHDERFLVVDSLTYVHASKLDYDKKTIGIFDKYLELKMTQSKEVSMDQLMRDNVNLLDSTELDNKRLLYSLLKTNLGHKYKFGKRNTLNIYADVASAKINLKDILYEYLKKNNYRANKEDIIKDLNWSSSQLDNMITNYDNFISLGNREIKYIDGIDISEEERKKLDEAIQGKLIDGYFSVKNLYFDMQFDKCLNNFIQKNKIENNLVLSQILKILYPEYVGHSSLLFNKASSNRSLEDIIFNKFTHLTKKELNEFVKKLGCGDMVYYNTLEKLISRGRYFEISDDELVRKDLFEIDDSIIRAVTEYISRYYEEKEFVILKSISGYRSQLPRIKYKWNPYLIRTILLRSGFRDIKKKVKDVRFDRLIMVKNSAEIRTLEELCYKLIKENYGGNMHQSNVYDYLAKKGILYEKESFSQKTLPMELRKGKLISVDEIGKVVLR